MLVIRRNPTPYVVARGSEFIIEAQKKLELFDTRKGKPIHDAIARAMGRQLTANQLGVRGCPCAENL
jgi:hypothetical protein